MIGDITKTDPGEKYVYLVINKFEIPNKRRGRELTILLKGGTYESDSLEENPNLKFLYKYRSSFIPQEMLEIEEVLRKYPVLRSATSDKIRYIYTPVENTIIERVNYIPIYTDIINWIKAFFSKKEVPFKKHYILNTYTIKELEDQHKYFSGIFNKIT